MLWKPCTKFYQFDFDGSEVVEGDDDVELSRGSIIFFSAAVIAS